MSKIYTVPELQTVLSPIFREHGVKKATLFGSYAKGAATSIDVTQIEKGSEIEREIQRSGVALFEQ